MNYFLIQKPAPILTRGVAVGWGFGPHSDVIGINAALPGWKVVLSPDAPASVSFAQDVAPIRKLTQAPPDAPVILFGLGAGCLSVRAMVLSRLLNPWAVALFGLPVPQDEAAWKLDLWGPWADRATDGRAGFVVTSTPQGLAALGLAGEPHASGLWAAVDAGAEDVPRLLAKLGPLP